MKRILYIEDSPVSIVALTMVCAQKGWQIDISTDGWDALARLMSDCAYDLVILDWWLPKSVSSDALKQIIERGKFKVIVYTGDRDVKVDCPIWYKDEGKLSDFIKKIEEMLNT
jgi:DNA-binding response OmpR family regulator